MQQIVVLQLESVNIYEYTYLSRRQETKTQENGMETSDDFQGKTFDLKSWVFPLRNDGGSWILQRCQHSKICAITVLYIDKFTTPY